VDADIFKSISQIPRPREVMKLLTTEVTEKTMQILAKINVSL
jgi:hypothetical protein